MRRIYTYGVVAFLSGCAAFAAAALLGVFSAFATPFVVGFPAPGPPDSTNYGRGMLMVIVGFCVFVALLISLWIAFFRYFWRTCEADLFIANGMAAVVSFSTSIGTDPKQQEEALPQSVVAQSSSRWAASESRSD
jgi:MFS family permease